MGLSLPNFEEVKTFLANNYSEGFTGSLIEKHHLEKYISLDLNKNPWSVSFNDLEKEKQGLEEKLNSLKSLGLSAKDYELRELEKNLTKKIGLLDLELKYVILEDKILEILPRIDISFLKKTKKYSGVNDLADILDSNRHSFKKLDVALRVVHSLNIPLFTVYNLNEKVAKSFDWELAYWESTSEVRAGRGLSSKSFATINGIEYRGGGSSRRNILFDSFSDIGFAEFEKGCRGNFEFHDQIVGFIPKNVWNKIDEYKNKFHNLYLVQEADWGLSNAKRSQNYSNGALLLGKYKDSLHLNPNHPPKDHFYLLDVFNKLPREYF